MKKQDTKRVFGFKELGITDLDGNFTPFTTGNGEAAFTVKFFANEVYKAGSKSIDMDNFLRELHANGEAEITDEIATELTESVSRIWAYAVVREVNLLIEKSKPTLGESIGKLKEAINNYRPK